MVAKCPALEVLDLNGNPLQGGCGGVVGAWWEVWYGRDGRGNPVGAWGGVVAGCVGGESGQVRVVK